MKRIYILVTVSGLLWSAPILFSQQPDAGTATPSPKSAPSAAPSSRPEAARMDIDFGGGSPADLLEAIHKASGQLPNVIMQSDAAKVRIPPFKLRGVSAAQIFVGLNTMSENPSVNGYWKAAPFSDGEIWTLVMPQMSPVAFDPTTGKPIGPTVDYGIQKNCKVLNLTMVLTDYSVDDVTTAMKGAWDLLGSKEAPTLKFHTDTKLLIIVGDDQQINVANDVLRELMMNVEMKRHAAMQAKDKAEGKKP
jgi:hypothetical protein